TEEETSEEKNLININKISDYRGDFQEPMRQHRHIQMQRKAHTTEIQRKNAMRNAQIPQKEEDWIKKYFLQNSRK
ncbi:MAG: hypothetical protein J7L66_03810, partial [Anaerolineaceae bacterium]|nr:hypothetical protein [Anaerolineaceae bacterium]